MVKLVILEGARGTGKSTIAFKLRQLTRNSTLINFTGFEDDNEEGLEKIQNYYDSWFTLLRNFKWKVRDQVIICDRFFPSEMVFSSLYKNYDFSSSFNKFCRLLPLVADEIYILNYTIHDKDELKTRLIRDKVPFGKAEESVVETLKQQDKYAEVFTKMKDIEDIPYYKTKVKIININTENKSLDELFSLSMEAIRN